MKRAIIVGLCLAFMATVAFAGPPNPSSRRATEIMFPIQDDGYRLMFEGFEGTFPPAGWTLAQTNTNETWGIETYDPFEGLQYASCQYDASYSGPQDEWLYFDYTIEAGDDCLSFYAFASTYWAVDPYQNYNILVTINDQTVWDYYNDNNGAVTWQWQQYSIDLSGYDVGETITVGFGYQGYDGAQGALDAVEIGECPPPPPEPCCPSDYVCLVHDFNTTSCGWSEVACGLGPVPWEWGVPTGIPTVACDDVAVTNVLGTALAGDYTAQTGEGAVIGPYDITQNCWCLELCHYYDIESGYDGGNVKVSTDGGATWTLVQPFGGYDDILDSTTYVAECVGGEEVFTGYSGTFVRDCFDLSAYMNESVLIGFFFGCDSSVVYPGWYLKWVKLGSDEITPVKDTSWGGIKAMYR
ncbi:MAG: hypothetical protein GF400_02080 [Candidatus Eisenbacteria bacterium]|nr:hypothetical protein [Candidatus Eisenbacteria bacterium]